MISVIKTRGMIDTHIHLRQDELRKPSIVHPLIDLSVEGGAIALGLMPNPKAGVHAPHDGLHTAEDVVAYVEHAAQANKAEFVQFIKIVLLTERTTKADIDACVAAGIMDAKIYPLDRTTGSDILGVRDFHELIPVLRHCGLSGMRVHIHPEHPLMDIHGREAESMFIPVMDMLMQATDEANTVFVWEHGTDARGIPFWKEWAKSGRFFVTITAHHLAADEDELYGDVRGVCKPAPKTRWDRDLLRALVLEGHSWIMAGTDSAPHDISAKQVEAGRCSCGAFTAPFALPLYAHTILDEPSDREIEVFRRFIYRNAKQLYNLPDLNLSEFELIREDFVIPTSYDVGPWQVTPFGAGRRLNWSLTL